MDLSQLAAGQVTIEASFKAVIDLVSDDVKAGTEVKPRLSSESPEANDVDNNEFESGTDDSGEVWETASLFEDALEEIGDEKLLEGGMLCMPGIIRGVVTKIILQERMSVRSKKRESTGASFERVVPLSFVKLPSKRELSQRRNSSQPSVSNLLNSSRVLQTWPTIACFPWL